MAGNVRDILINLLGRETISTAAKKAEDGLDRLGDQMDETADDAARLDREIEQAEKALQDLAVQFARTDDAAKRMDLAKAMRKQQSEVRRLVKARDLLPDMAEAGAEAATGFGASFAGRIGPILAKAPVSPAGAAIGAALGVAVAPALGAAVSGAIVGGVGVGGVVGGIKLAARDSRVKAAGGELADTVTADLEGSATRFVGPTIQSIGIIQSAWSDVSDDVDDVFAAASRYVVPLARGVADAVRQIAPGFRDAARAAGPVIREMSEGLPRIGDAIGDVLSDISGDADAGASAIRGMVISAESGIRTFGALASGAADVYRNVLTLAEGSGEVADAWVGWVPILGSSVDSNNAKLAELRAALEAGGDAGGEAGKKTAGGLDKTAEAAGDATKEVETLTEALDRMAGEAIESERLQMRLAEAIDRATAAGKANNDGISEGTEKGRANREILLGMGEAARKVAADIRTQTGNHQEANRVLEEARAKFLAAAAAMGAESEEAVELANKLFGIPNINRTVSADTSPARTSVAAYQRWLASVNLDKTSTITQRYVREQQTARGGVREFSRGGYVDGPGPRGVDSVDARLAPGEGVLTVEEVDAAGGPAGLARLRAALRAGRSGAPALMAGMGGAMPAQGSARVVEHRHVIVIEGTGVLAGLRREIRILGGDVQTVLGR